MQTRVSDVASQAAWDSRNRGDASSGKLAKAAREFESILLASWLEKMNQTIAEGDGDQDPGHDSLTSLGMQAVATAISSRGGIGIAHMIEQQLGGRSGVEEDGPVLEKPEREKK